MENLISETEKFAVELLNNNLDSRFVYHNLAHTQRVVEKANELADLAQIDLLDKKYLIVSAWLHDIGYTETIDKHELHSVKIAEEFLKEKGCNKEDIKAISQLILATQMNYEPKNQLEKIIRDADCAHIGSKNYIDISELLRKEFSLLLWEFLQVCVMANLRLKVKQ